MPTRRLRSVVTRQGRSRGSDQLSPEGRDAPSGLVAWAAVRPNLADRSDERARRAERVTRVAYSACLNSGKYNALLEQARRLGRVRSEVWQRYGSVSGVGSGLSDRQVRDRWLADGTYVSFGVLANAWKETVRDAMADISANMEAAKVQVGRAIVRHINDPAERKRTFSVLRSGRWANDPFLARQMRKHWKRRLGRRNGDRLHCTSCGVVWQADVNAAINILHRAGDPDIALHTPHHKVKQLLQDRTDRHRTRLPVQDSSPATAERRANHPNRSAMSMVGSRRQP